MADHPLTADTLGVGAFKAEHAKGSNSSNYVFPVEQAEEESRSSKHVNMHLPILRPITPAKFDSNLSVKADTRPPRLTPIKEIGLRSISPVKSSPLKPNHSPSTPSNAVASIQLDASPLRDEGTSTSITPNTIVRRLFQDNQSEPVSAKPAFKRFHHLIFSEEKASKIAPSFNEECPFAITLPLPYKWTVLVEIFRAVETVISISYNRSESRSFSVTFTMLKEGVKNLLPNVAFSRKELGRILTLVPDAYVVLQNDLEIALNPSFGNRKVDTMTGDIVVERRQAFVRCLLQKCYDAHKEFLANLNPSIIIPTNKKITRWHTKFILEDVPEIVPSAAVFGTRSKAELEVREVSTTRHTAARVAILKAKRKLLRIAAQNPKMKSALLKQNKFLLSDRKDFASGNSTLISDNLQGVSKQLLAKIRSQEESKVIHALTMTATEATERETLSRVPAYLSLIRHAILVEKKDVIALQLLKERIVESQKSEFRHPNLAEVENVLKLIARLFPNWLKIFKGTQGEYVKMDKVVDINDILSQLNTLV